MPIQAILLAEKRMENLASVQILARAVVQQFSQYRLCRLLIDGLGCCHLSIVLEELFSMTAWVIVEGAGAENTSVIARGYPNKL